MAGVLELVSLESRNCQFEIPLASAFCPSSIARSGVFCPQPRRKRDVPKSRIIATGSTGAIGGHCSFIVHTLSVQARIARGRGEGNMKLPRRQFLHLAAGAAALPAVSRIAWAQTYPTRPVRIVAPTAPGGAPDILARLIGQWLSERLGQPFVIENRPGSGNNIGTEAVVRAPPDGYTLLMVSTSNAINATLYDKLNFVFLRDIAPVAVISLPFVMVVNPSVPAKTVPELTAYAKANPGKIKYGVVRHREYQPRIRRAVQDDDRC